MRRAKLPEGKTTGAEASLDDGGVPKGPRRPKDEPAQRGIALLMVLICLAVLLPFTATFNYNARVDWQSAVNHGDEIRARNVQRGAMQLAELLFLLQREVFNQKQFKEFVGSMDITQVAPYLMSIFGSKDGAAELGGLVGMDTSALSDLSLGASGAFEFRVEAESGRVNVNCLAVKEDGKNQPKSRTVEVLEQLMSPTIYDPLFDEEKADGERYSRQVVLTAMADYIDDDRKRFDIGRLKSSSVGENYNYTELYDPYQARNARLDSLEELHLVEGIDDDWMAAFAEELTIYGECKVNLNFASPAQIAMVLRHSVSARDKWKTEGDNFLMMTMPLANFVAESREFNTLFGKLDEVKKLVAKPDEFVNPLTLLGGGADQDNNLPKVPDGMEVRVKGGSNKETGDTWGGLKEVATVKPERIYRIEIISEVGSVRKRATGIYDMQYARSQSQGKGAWLYFRED